MRLTSQAAHVYAEYGEEGLRRWEERLTPEQRLALVHEWDQFGAAFNEVAASLGVVTSAIGEMQDAVAKVVDDLRHFGEGEHP